MSDHTNADRQNLAARTLRYYAEAKGENPESCDLVDLLADLMHYAAREGIDFHGFLECAGHHFNTEQKEIAE